MNGGIENQRNGTGIVAAWPVHSTKLVDRGRQIWLLLWVVPHIPHIPHIPVFCVLFSVSLSTREKQHARYHCPSDPLREATQVKAPGFSSDL